MRLPFKTETDALRMTMALGFVIAASVLVGALTSRAYGVVVFAAGIAAGITFELSGREADAGSALREATHAPHPEAGSARGRHILVVALETLAGERLAAELTAAGGADLQLDVLAPVLSSRSHYWSSDIDRECDAARQRLEASLAWAAARGFKARGEVGDPDPLVAVEDELRAFGADEVFVVMHARDHMSWLANRLIGHLSTELDVPVREFVAGDDQAREDVAQERPPS
jgi:hypothetical protein